MCPTLGQVPWTSLESRPSTEATTPVLGHLLRVDDPDGLQTTSVIPLADLSLCICVFLLQNWCACPPFSLSAFLASSCPLQGCLAGFLPPSLPLLLGLLCISCNVFWKFCRIIFLTPCPFSPNASYLKNELFVIFQEICLGRVLAAPRSWEALGHSSSRSCIL